MLVFTVLVPNSPLLYEYVEDLRTITTGSEKTSNSSVLSDSLQS